MKYGFVNVAAAVPTVKVADVDYNVQQVESLIAQAEGRGVEVIVFPELCITGYTCQDLFKEQLLLDRAEQGVIMLLDFTRKLDVISIVGAPVVINGLLYNCAVVIQGGNILGIVPKTYLPNYAEFYEKRWFASAQDLNPIDLYFAGNSVRVSAEPQVFVTSDGMKFGVEICEDVWAPIPPSNNLALAGADIIFNLSASDELIGKHAYLKSLLAQQSARTVSGYVYASCGFGESTQDVVYGGNALIYENGKLLVEGSRFSIQPQIQMCQIDIEKLRVERRQNTTFINAQRGAVAREIQCRLITPRDFELLRHIDSHPFIPKEEDMQTSCEEILNIQVAGLAKRLYHINGTKAVIGISGGLDSTLALLVTVKAFDKLALDRRGIIGITMPGFGTTDRTHNNAMKLMETLGVTIREINIAKAVTQHFEDIGQSAKVHDVTYENSQARERTQILMDVANKENAIVVGTGDLSELALGWATYNGDHMSMYGVNAGIPKTLIRFLVSYVAGEMATETLLDIIDTPISPELIPADEQGNIKQKTEDLVGPYELHDFFIYYFLRYGFSPKKIFLLAQRAFADIYDEETIKKWLTTFCRRFFNQQFKRSCLPDGPKVGSVSLSPRGDWRMPSDASSSLWMKECEEL
ncbi:NAD+ synthase (glutamine-hydrolysing) [Xylanibacter ruminicola]|uniref:Glutamine-dependent NAD(+) synthetase n=1 Tax=Xylanibacter ruminicola TaxID=839 RepID=A0A1H5U263_XYLRU|nr:NAD(+) synthase [Xylanibacter ruminicola]SEF69175.1 NAD+ synthase (glutamine-hydrolysing) [Xylanibacter ruminicola]